MEPREPSPPPPPIRHWGGWGVVWVRRGGVVVRWGGVVVHQEGQHGAAGPVLHWSSMFFSNLVPYDSSHCPMKRTTLLQICIVSVIAEAVVLGTCKMVI